MAKGITQTDRFVLFWGGWPSQWHPARFAVEGVAYNCCEQYMMAEKARVFGDEDALAQVLASKSPREQKAIGRRVAKLRPRRLDRRLSRNRLRRQRRPLLPGPGGQSHADGNGRSNDRRSQPARPHLGHRPGAGQPQGPEPGAVAGGQLARRRARRRCARRSGSQTRGVKWSLTSVWRGNCGGGAN